MSLFDKYAGMTIPRTAAAVILLLLLGTASLFAQQPPRPPQIMVEAPPGLEGTAAQLRSVNPSRLASVMRLVGLTDPGPPVRVILAPEESTAPGIVPPWVSGYAVGEQGVIVLLPGRVPSYPDSSLQDLLSHEMAHVLVSLAAAESSFWDRQTFWYRWVPVLTSSVTLWMIVTLLALWAIKRRRERDAALRRMWDEEDERLRLAAVAVPVEVSQVPPKDEAGEWVN